MDSEVQRDTPEFAATCRVVATVCGSTPAAVANELVRLRATQYERLVSAASGGRNEEHRAALVRIALAENKAEQAVAIANTAKADVARLPAEYSVPPRVEELIGQAEALATDALTSVAEARAGADAANPPEVATAGVDVQASQVTSTLDTSSPTAAPGATAPEVAPVVEDPAPAAPVATVGETAPTPDEPAPVPSEPVASEAAPAAPVAEPQVAPVAPAPEPAPAIAPAPEPAPAAPSAPETPAASKTKKGGLGSRI
jgi:hypothetical protein